MFAMDSVNYTKALSKNYNNQKSRWLLLLIFVLGYITTFPIFEYYALEYFLLTILSLFCSILLLWVLKQPFQVTLPYWIVFLIFLVAYYFKFYFIINFPELPFDQHILVVESITSTEALISAYASTTYGFSAYCIVSWFLLSGLLKKEKILPEKMLYERKLSSIRFSFVISVSVLVAIPLMIITTLITHSLKIAVMGAESVYLPFKLAGIIYYTRTMFIPIILTMLIWSGKQINSRFWVVSGVILLVFHGISEMIIRQTKSGLLVLLPIFFIYLLHDKRLKKEIIKYFLILSILLILLYPIALTYRFMGGEVNITDILTTMLEFMNSGSLSFFVISEAFKMFLMRITGIEHLVVYNYENIFPLGWQAWEIITLPRGLSGFVTVEVYGFSPDAPHSTATSFFGWFYLIGGNFSITLGTILFTIFTGFLWRIIKRMSLYCLPIAQAWFLWLLLLIVVDGAFEYLSKMIPSIVFSLCICEYIIRLSANKNKEVICP